MAKHRALRDGLVRDDGNVQGRDMRGRGWELDYLVEQGIVVDEEEEREWFEANEVVSWKQRDQNPFATWELYLFFFR